ncbi:MAG TPA: cell division protein ZapE [Nocardioidaceae bacterium]|nr:cell division protein ZapE [Nocardioidaceae bacterium]
MTVALDPDQERALDALRRLGEDLGRRRRLPRSPQGVYLWGRPGRGKTWLMDHVFDQMTSVPSWRVHFHEFLSSPTLPPGIRLLCFDEFHVHDVGDAMFLRRMLAETARRRIAVVATSNYAPEGLLPNPMHHHHVLPAVAAIRGSMQVVRVDGPVDYRREAPRNEGFGSGHIVDPGSASAMARALESAEPSRSDTRILRVRGRDLRALAVRGREVWFDFHDLCVRPVSVHDYLELTRDFSSWVVVGVPDFDTTTREAPQRLANLVDVLHDRDLPLHLGCDVGLHELAGARRQPLDPDRTFSRLGLLLANSRGELPVSR